MVSIRWVLEDFTDLKRFPCDVSLEFSFIKLVIISDGDYFRRVSWDARCQSCINHVVVRNAQRACAFLFEQVFSCRDNIVNRCRLTMVTIRSINDLEWLVILVSPSITLCMLYCSNILPILFPS